MAMTRARLHLSPHLRRMTYWLLQEQMGLEQGVCSDGVGMFLRSCWIVKIINWVFMWHTNKFGFTTGLLLSKRLNGNL